MHRVLLTSTGMLLGLLATTGAIAADGQLDADAVERMRPVIPAAIDYYNARSDDALAVLTTGQIEELLEGKVVRIRRRPPRDAQDPPERVTGYRIVTAPRDVVWIAALDPEFQATDLLTERRISRDESGTSLWHQYLSLPWPVTDRQWVINVGASVALADSTSDLVWEQTWKLAESGEQIAAASIASGKMGDISVEEAEAAIYVPANEGSWVLFALEGDITLVGYRVIARVGGSIPDSWIASVGMAQLTQVLNSVASHASEVALSYDPTRHPILGGDGVVIERF